MLFIVFYIADGKLYARSNLQMDVVTDTTRREKTTVYEQPPEILEMDAPSGKNERGTR